MAIEIRTLRQFYESEQSIECDCSNYFVCSHTGPLRLEMAIQRLGWEFDFYVGREALAGRLYCSICGKRQPTFRLGSRMPKGGHAGTHGAGAVPRSVLDVASRVPSAWAEPVDWLAGGKTVRKFGPRR